MQPASARGSAWARELKHSRERVCHFPWQLQSLLGKLGSTLSLLARQPVIGVRHTQVPAKDNGLLIKVGGAKAQSTPWRSAFKHLQSPNYPANNSHVPRERHQYAQHRNLLQHKGSCAGLFFFFFFIFFAISWKKKPKRKVLSSIPGLKLLFLPR